MGEETIQATTLPIPRLGRGARIIGVVATVLLAGLIALWLVRKPIAEHYIDDILAGARVPARYEIADLALGGQRLTNVVVGDPAHPDLVADWIETQTAIGFSGAAVTGLRAGKVRMRGRIVDGRLSLGAIDRLLPSASGKPFALPTIALDIADGRMRLETPQGAIGLKLGGKGRLDNGFAGRLAAVSDRLAAGGCVATRTTAAVAVRVNDGALAITGPVRAGRVTCGGVAVTKPVVRLDLSLAPALDRWTGRARVTSRKIVTPIATLSAAGGSIGFAGTAHAMTGDIDLTGTDARGAQGSARSVAAVGHYRVAGTAIAYDGRVQAGGATVAPALLGRAAGWAESAAGTPVAPIAVAVARAVAAAGRDFTLDADLAVGGGRAIVRRATLASASGARMASGGGSGVALAAAGVRLDTNLRIAGGGLPDARVMLSQGAPGAPIRGTATISRYAAGGASLALTPVVFSANPRGATRIATTATLSGPVAGGRIDALTLPVAALWDGAARLVVNPDCASAGFQRLTITGLTLGATRLALCPVDGGLLRIDGATIGGGARIAAPRLTGTLGGTPIALAATDARIALRTRDFVVDGLTARFGRPESVSRIDIARLQGRVTGNRVAGSFSGGTGQIGAVPLLMADAAGDWSLANGDLAVRGTTGVADASPDPRFKPLVADAVSFTLSGGAIAVAGTLVTPDHARRVADVRIAHTLASGIGHADLTVPGIAFDEDFQPERLTRLTFGVIADVVGSISGAGHIRWSPAGVTSDGVFATAGTDLAAAFGPVTGITGRIRFTDLLALESAPGQIATIASVNPGIPVTDGVITYQTYRDSRVLVNSGRWPFAGGTLTLDPTLLDFSQSVARRMTFRVDGMAADQFLQQFDFKNLNATGIFDGVLPMVFDASGGRIEKGSLTVRDGGGTIAYVGEVSQKDLGTWGNLAFQALKSLRYRSLDLTMNGPLAGEMVTQVHFAGISQGAGAKTNFLIRRLQKLPFVFNVTIKAPFRGLIDSAQSFYDPKRLIERNLPALIQEQNKATPPPATPPIQPPASRTVP